MEVYMAQDFYMGAEFGYQLAQEELDKLNHINEALEEAVDVFGEKIDDLIKIEPSQDELWEEIWDLVFDYERQRYREEAKKRYRITRVK